MMSWFLDNIPWEAYATLGVLITAALFYFFSPILIPLWNVTPKWVKVTGGFIGGLFLAVMYGRNKGAADEKARLAKRDAQAIQKRNEVDHEVANLDRPAVDKRLDKWMRD